MDQLHLNPYLISIPTEISDRADRERFPQWTQAETKEFLAIRAELDRSFTETKRNKPLWEIISSRMQQKGFTRTPDQCKSKWKNLVTRLKGSEAMEGDRQFPFHDEMRGIFSDRMERLLHFNKGKGMKNDDEEEEKEEECKKKKRKVERKGLKGERELEGALREFGRRQMEMEMRWVEAMEAREAERRWKEEEWRREMEALKEERAAVERMWREREEERWAREEARAERHHAIITDLLTELTNKGL